MNLRHMEVFHAIYVNGSVVRAARALNVSQPSVSKVLAHAEIQLGFPLFQRLRGRLIPTDEAHVLFRQVSEIHTRLASVRQTSRNLKGGVGGYLRLAVLPALGLAAAPEAVATLLKRHPSINIDVQTMHHTDILRSLIERDSDLAIGYEEPNHPGLDSRRIGKAELVVFFPKTLIPEPPDRISLKALEDMVVISLANSGPLGNLFSNETVEHNLDIKEQISVRTFYVAAGLVKAGAGVAVIDEFTARATLSDELDFRPLDPPISFGVHCIFLVDRPPSILGNEFIAIFSKILEK